MILKRLTKIGGNESLANLGKKVENELSNIHKVLNSLSVAEDPNGHLILEPDRPSVKRNDAYYIESTVKKSISSSIQTAIERAIEENLPKKDTTPPDNTSCDFIENLI